MALSIRNTLTPHLHTVFQTSVCGCAHCSTHHIGDIIWDLIRTLLVWNVLNYRDRTINFPVSLSIEKCTVHVFCEVWELWENMVYLGDSEQIWLCPGGSKGTQLTLAGREPVWEDTILLWVGLKSQGRTPTLGGLRGCSLFLGDLIGNLDIKNL